MRKSLASFVVVVAAVTAVIVGTAGCLDVRDYEGQWTGPRVGERAELGVGFAADADATLDIDDLSLRSVQARLTIAGVMDAAAIAPIPGAEADAVATMTFRGDPVRVFLAFAQTADGGGDALVMVALYDDDRVEVRVMRGGPTPLYGVFALARGG